MKKIVSMMVLILFVSICFSGCTTSTLEENGYKEQEEIITGTVEKINQNMVGQRYVRLDHNRTIKFDISDQTIDSKIVIIKNESQLKYVLEIEEGDYCEFELKRHVNVYYPCQDIQWELTKLTIIKND
jgi:hypothetical protein